MPSVAALWAIALALTIGYRFYVGRKKTRLTAHLPRPAQGPFYKRLLIDPSSQQLIDWALEIPNDGLIAYRSFLNEEKLLVTSPTAIHDIEVAQAYSFEKPAAVTKMLKAWLGEGLVCVEGDTHKQQRKIIGQLFKAQWVKDLYPLFWSKTCEMIESIQRQSTKDGIVNMYDPFNRMSLDIIGLGGFGLDIGCLRDPDNVFYGEYMKFFMPSGQGAIWRFLSKLLPEWLVDVLPIKGNEELQQATKAVRDLIQVSITHRRREMIVDDDEKREGRSLRLEGNIISALMRGGWMSDIEMLINQSMTLLGAGHDTVAQTLTWTMYELCLHQDVQLRLREAVSQVIKLPLPTEPGGALLEQIVDDIPYLTSVINEALRLHPSVPDLNRQAVVPAIVNGLELQPGMTCVLSLGAINRSLELWGKDAGTFNPGRWLNDKLGGAKTRNSFQTFGGGPKVCIGERFARAELAVIVALLVRSFEMELAGDDEAGACVEYGATARFVGGLSVRCKAL